MDQMIKDPDVSFNHDVSTHLSENTDGKSSSVILHEDNSEVTDVSTQNACADIGIQNAFADDGTQNAFDQNIYQLMPAEPLQALEVSDPSVVVLPGELTSFVINSSFQIWVPTYAANDALHMAQGSSLFEGVLLDDQSFSIPEMGGPSNLNHHRKAIVCPSNARVLQHLGVFLPYGGSRMRWNFSLADYFDTT